jgi:hypothetical protein
MVVLGSCVVRAVQPEPPPPGRSTTVYLLSEEGHTGILLPHGEGWVEWAFGDYAWYAAGRGDLGWGLYTAMRATTGGLARRTVAGDPLLDCWSRARGTVLFPYPADRDAVAALAARLETEFRAGGQPSFNPLFGFHVVPARAPYSMWFNCTDAAATWLAELGIEAPTRGICARILGRPGTELAAPPPDDGELVRDRVRAFGGVAGDGRGQ